MYSSQLRLLWIVVVRDNLLYQKDYRPLPLPLIYDFTKQMITSAIDMHILRGHIRKKALNNLKQASVTLPKKIFRIFSMNLENNIDKWLKGFGFIFSWSEDESQTLMVDPNGEVYLIGVIYSGRGMVSHLPASAWGSSTPVNIETTQFLPIHTHHHDPVSGDISRDGTELLIKSKSNIFYWKIENGDVLTSLTKPPVEVPYHPTSLGEAICWSADGQSYYTLPEGHHPALYVYSRLGGGHGSSSVIGK